MWKDTGNLILDTFLTSVCGDLGKPQKSTVRIVYLQTDVLIWDLLNMKHD
jgi:hypothetical protein